jgi:hypothetical protein
VAGVTQLAIENIPAGYPLLPMVNKLSVINNPELDGTSSNYSTECN